MKYIQRKVLFNEFSYVKDQLNIIFIYYRLIIIDNNTSILII